MNAFRNTMATVQMIEDSGDAGAVSPLTGLYLLKHQGGLHRLQPDFTTVAEPELEAGLGSGLRQLLESHRNTGQREGWRLGLLVIEEASGQGTGRVVFGDATLNTLFDAGREPGMPLTLYEQRNRSKTVFQAMELLLNKKLPDRPLFPYYCPLLVESQSERAELCRQYRLQPPESGRVYELMDIAAPYSEMSCPPDALFSMRSHMREAQVLPRADGHPGVHDRGGQLDGGLSVSSGSMTLADGEQPFGSTHFRDGEAVTGWLLEWFSPFNDLTETQREIIAGYEAVRKVDAGTRLIEKGTEQDLCLYLVEGEIALTTEDGATMSVIGGTRRSRLPISMLSPHVYDVTAVTDVSIITFSQGLIRRIYDITKTYTSIDRCKVPESSTAAISNGAQAEYINHAGTGMSLREL